MMFKPINNCNWIDDVEIPLKKKVIGSYRDGDVTPSYKIG